ncbi:hypothetical protein OT109_06735 [Phycisphaeraceae bacterium D3-23]
MTRFNPLRLTTAALAIAAMSVFAVGCDSGTTDTPNPETGEHGEHGHGEHTLGTVNIEGRSVTVNIPGELEAGKTYAHCHLTVTGDTVDKMRIWIGDASGEDALKGNVTGIDQDHPIVDLEAPADLEGAVLGVEIEVGGETYTATTPIEDHHDEDGEDHHDEAGDGHDEDHDDDHGHDHGEGGDHDHDH